MKRWCPLCEEHTEVRLCGERIEDATGLGYACPDEHPILHAVRAHLRHYQSGMVVKVRAHSRGHGELFQVKDYRIPAT